MKKILSGIAFAALLQTAAWAQQNTSYNLNTIPIMGTYNTAFGFQTMLANTTGNWNSASGYQSLKSNTSGLYNTGHGYQSLVGNTSGLGNTGTGYWALKSNTTANNNTATGFSALYLNTTGEQNTALGAFANIYNTTGTNNTAIGAFSTVATNNLVNATALGAGASVANSNSIQLGNSSVTTIYAGTGTTAKLITGGLQVTGGTIAAGKVLTSDATGNATWQSLPASPAVGGWSTTGNAGTVPGTNFIGTTDNVSIFFRVSNQHAGRIDGLYGGNANTYLGFLSGLTGGGSHNCGIGFHALKAIAGGAFNVAVGVYALKENTIGTDNCAIGYNSLGANTDGHTNTAIGASTLAANNNGTYNTACGGYALSANVSGNHNTALGWSALNVNFSGYGNASVGNASLMTNYSGYNNSALGVNSLISNSSGFRNVAVGHSALWDNTTGSNNTGLGYDSDVSTGNLTNATALGASTIVNASNKVRIGATTVTSIEGQVPFFAVSDGRFKSNISEDDVKGLEFITRLRPVVYNLDTRKLQEFLTQNMADSVQAKYLSADFSASTDIRQSGFIAQEVEKIAKEVNYDFNGVHVPEDENDNYSIAYSQFVVPLVKGMQEQQAMIEAQNNLLAQQQKEIDALKEIVSKIVQNSADKSSMGMGATSPMEAIQVFPNPSAGLFSIRLQNIQAEEMEIFNANGQKLQTLPLQKDLDTYAIDLSGKPKGVYTLVVRNGNQSWSQKLIVE